MMGLGIGEPLILVFLRSLLLAESGHSGLGLLRYFEGVVELDSKVADRALELAVAKE